ncbi:MAG: hypothetical protein J5I81_01575 [Nitrococcus mobilis]|nr:hypothetical protein [Nitrococcus mobilis]
MLHISGHVRLDHGTYPAAPPSEQHVTAEQCHIRQPWGSVTIRTDAGHRITHYRNRIAVHDGRLTSEALRGQVAGNGAFLILEYPDGPDAPFIIHTDRLGTIPVYYGRRNARLSFASRLPVLLEAGFDSPDPIGAVQMMLCGYPLGSRSLLEGVSLAPPASELRIHPSGSVTAERYWRPEPNPDDGPVAPKLADELLDRLQAAQHRATPDGQELAIPITGGLDSRINLALCGDRLAAAFLFHIGLPGDPEGPIARRIASVLGLPMAELKLKPDIIGAGWERFAEAETGELSPEQLWLGGVGAFVHRNAPGRTLLDGYLQDALFNPRMVTEQVQEQRDTAIWLARRRWEAVGKSNGDPLLAQVLGSIDTAFGVSGAPSPLAASQRFYLENRSRRFVFGAARLAQNHIAVATPALDSELMDYALALPWSARRNGPLYRALILRLAPELGEIAYDKTGRPLKHGLRVTRRRRLAKALYRGLDRFWPSRPLLRTAPSPMRLLLDGQETLARIRDLLNRSEWVAALVGTAGSDVLERFLERKRPDPGMPLVALLTLAQLEQCRLSVSRADASVVRSSG